MAFRIRTNVPSLYAQRNLGLTMGRINNTISKLSSGLRINKAADDPAGLAISERLTTQVNGLAQAERNAQDAISLVQIAEGGLAQIGEILQRMRTLSVQAANATNTSTDRTLIQVEINQLVAEIDRQVSTAEFNNQQLLQTTTTFAFQVGADKNETLSMTISAMSATGLGVNGLTITGATATNAQNAISTLDTAIDRLSSARGKIGAYQNRLENAINFIGISKENMTAARSRIQDADMAQEVVSYTRDTILLQTGTAFLAQANVIPTQALSLIQ